MTWDGLGWVDFGEPDRAALEQVRTTVNRHEPLVGRVEYVGLLNPTELRLPTTAGFETDAWRFDVGWTAEGEYRYHHTENESFGVRYDRYPYPDALGRHFHPPACANHDAEQSCIEMETLPLVTLAVPQCGVTRSESAATRPSFDSLTRRIRERPNRCTSLVRPPASLPGAWNGAGVGSQ